MEEFDRSNIPPKAISMFGRDWKAVYVPQERITKDDPVEEFAKVFNLYKTKPNAV